MKAYRWTNEDGDEMRRVPYSVPPDDPRIEWVDGPPPESSTLTPGRLALLVAVGLTAWLALAFIAWLIWTALR